MIVSFLLTTAAATAQKSFLQAYASDFDEDSVRPIQRVVKLLNDMKEQLDKEADKDKDLYEELTCWCKENDKEKSQAVKDAEAKIGDLEAEIEGRAARQGELTTTIAQLKKEIKKNSESLATATKLREDEQKEFRAQHKDLVQAISSLKQAVQVLSKHQTSLVDLSPEVKLSLKSVLHNAGEMHRAFQMDKADSGSKTTAFLSVGTGVMAEYIRAVQDPRSTALTVDQSVATRVLAAAFNQESNSQPAGYKSYNSRSGQIFGILGSMLDEFEKKAGDDLAEENKAQSEFEELEKAKTQEIESAEKQLEQKKSEAGTNGKKLADAKEELTATREAFSSDKAFLRNLQLQCNSIDYDFSQRTKTRSEEIAAIGEALKILTEDDNRDALRKTTFLQMSMNNASLRERVVHMLNSADVGDDLEHIWKGRNESPRTQLSTLAIRASLDSFEKVKAAMDQMIAELKNQQEEENKHKDFCNEEFTENSKQERGATFKKEDLNTTIENLDNEITTAKAEIAKAQKEIARVQVEIKRAGEDREKENKQFQTEINDQRATQEILQRVLGRLNVFYKKNKEEAPAPALIAQTPPKSFGAYKSNTGANPVFSLIEKIVADSKASEAEAISDEKSSQKDYETFVSDSNANVASLQRQVISKSDAVGTAEEDKAQAQADYEFTLSELEKLANYRADLHGSCDFLLKNFDLRQEAREQEREAIAQAKAILSGAMTRA